MVESGNRIGTNPPENNSFSDRLSQVNVVLSEHGLSNPFPENGLGDLDRGEIEILGTGEVIPLGDEGLTLVHLPAQFTKDSVDEKTGEAKPGAKGAFWTFFETKERTQNGSIVIPFVTDAPGNFETPSEAIHPSRTINRINRQLADLKLKPLPMTVNAKGETITGIEDVVRNNERFFTVVIFKVRNENGEFVRRPYVFNANSDSGFDGTVFSAIVRPEHFGGEPRIVLGDTYRPNLGGWVVEAPRGFYSPRMGGEKRGFQAKFTDVPVIKRAIEELSDETGLISSANLRDVGKVSQDPTFEASRPNYFNLDVETPEFTTQDLEVSEKIRLRYLTPGEFFSKIPDIQDPFTLCSVGRDLLARGALQVSKRGIDAQNRGERLVLQRLFRPQFGEYTIEAIRQNINDIRVDYSHGNIPVNSGIARIMPEMYHGTMTWEEYKDGRSNSEIQRVHLVYPYEALRDIAYGKYDIVTTASVIKALHSKGYLDLNLSSFFK